MSFSNNEFEAVELESICIGISCSGIDPDPTD